MHMQVPYPGKHFIFLITCRATHTAYLIHGPNFPYFKNEYFPQMIFIIYTTVGMVWFHEVLARYFIKMNLAVWKLQYYFVMLRIFTIIIKNYDIFKIYIIYLDDIFKATIILSQFWKNGFFYIYLFLYRLSIWEKFIMLVWVWVISFNILIFNSTHYNVIFFLMRLITTPLCLYTLYLYPFICW